MNTVTTHFSSLPEAIRQATMTLEAAIGEVAHAEALLNAAHERQLTARAALAQAIGNWQRESVRVAVADAVADAVATPEHHPSFQS